MELTPKLLTEDVDFRVAYRGYDRDEVDDFLERVAVAVGQLQQQLGEAVGRARSAEARLKAAADAPAAQSAAPAPAAPAPAAPAPAVSLAPSAEAEDLNEELRRTLVLAQRTADAAIREARERAAQTQADADERAQRTLADAEAGARRKADEARTRLLAEVAELEGIRESMRSDVSVLERHLEEQRLQLRSSFQELQRLLDDPSSFRISPTPPLSGVAAPTAARESAPQSGRALPGGAAPPAEGPSAAPPAAAGEHQEAAAPARSAPAAAPREQPAPAQPEPARPEQPRRTEQARGEQPRPAAPRPPEGGSVSFREGAAPASAGRGPDPGPRTQPVAAARFEEDDNDAFLAELRKAMADEVEASRPEEGGTALFDQDDRSRQRPRFGRRR